MNKNLAYTQRKIGSTSPKVCSTFPRISKKDHHCTRPSASPSLHHASLLNALLAHASPPTPRHATPREPFLASHSSPGMPHHASPPTSRHNTPRLAATRHASPQHATPRHNTPRLATTHHASPRHTLPRHATPRLALPRHAIPRLASPVIPRQPCLACLTMPCHATSRLHFAIVCLLDFRSAGRRNFCDFFISIVKFTTSRKLHNTTYFYLIFRAIKITCRKVTSSTRAKTSFHALIYLAYVLCGNSFG